MRLILDGLRQSFVSCACGAAAKDCALRLMETFAEGKPFPPDILSADDPQAMDDVVDPEQEEEPQNKHPGSMKELLEISKRKHQKAKAAKADSRRGSATPGGPLVGATRGIRAKVVGGSDAGTFSGVRNENGDDWDRFGVFERADATDEEGEGRNERRSVPEVRIEDASPGGKGTRGGHSEKNGRRRRVENTELSPHLGPPTREITPNTDQDEDAGGAEKPEEKMPPKMRKRWIAEKRASQKKEIGEEGVESPELSTPLRETIARVPQPQETTSDQEVEQVVSPIASKVVGDDAAMDVDVEVEERKEPASKSVSPTTSLAPSVRSKGACRGFILNMLALTCLNHY